MALNCVRYKGADRSVLQGATGPRQGQTDEHAVVFIICEEARSWLPLLVCLHFIHVLVCICFMSLNKSHVSQAGVRLPVQAKGMWPSDPPTCTH